VAAVTRHSDAEPEINLPLRGDVQIDGGENPVLLLANGKEAAHGTGGTVVFEAAGDFRREVVAEFEIRRKDHALVNALAVE